MSYPTARRLIDEGLLTAHKRPGYKRWLTFYQEDVDEYLARREVQDGGSET